MKYVVWCRGHDLPFTVEAETLVVNKRRTAKFFDDKKDFVAIFHDVDGVTRIPKDAPALQGNATTDASVSSLADAKYAETARTGRSKGAEPLVARGALSIDKADLAHMTKPEPASSAPQA